MVRQADVVGPLGLSPLHLAAIAADRGAAARKLLTRCPPGPTAWLTARTTDGATPADFAAAMGAKELVCELTAMAHLAIQAESSETCPQPRKAERREGLLQTGAASAAQLDSKKEVVDKAEIPPCRNLSSKTELGSDASASFTCKLKARAEVGEDAATVGERMGNLAVAVSSTDHAELAAPGRQLEEQSYDPISRIFARTRKIETDAGGRCSDARKDRRKNKAPRGKCNRMLVGKAEAAPHGASPIQRAGGKVSHTGPLLPVTELVP